MPDTSVEEAYSKWAPDLVSYASALVGPADAADVVADAFVRVVERQAMLWPAVREPRRYLFGAVLNSARLHQRGRFRRERREWRWQQSSSSVDVLDEPRVVDALAGLSVQQRAVIYLTYWEDLDVEAVAALLGVRAGTVKRQLARARAKLREVLT